MKSIIKNFIAKRVAGRSDDGIMITLTDPKKVDFQAAMLEDLLMRNGFNPADITSEQQLKNILNQIDAINKQTGNTPLPTGIRNTESGKVFEITTGKEIPKGSKIMGGQAVDDLPPPGSRGGDDDIAAPFQSQEETLRNMTEAEIKANIEAQNKKGIENILKRKNREDVYGLEDYDTTNMSEIKKEIIRTETKLGNLNPNNPGFRERAKPLIDKIEALKKKLREDKADGGRTGFFTAGLASGDDVSPGSSNRDTGGKNDGPSPRERYMGSQGKTGKVDKSLDVGGPGVDDRGSPEQNMVQSMYRAGMTPDQINRAARDPRYDIAKSVIGNVLTGGLYGMMGEDIKNVMKVINAIESAKDVTGTITPNQFIFGNKDDEDEDENAIDKIFSDKPAKDINKIYGTGAEERAKMYEQYKADGGRIGLKVGTGKRFLQKVFGKEAFEEMKSRDPEMYIGLLEVANMYRKRDKEGLKMYLQKFLPHMDDAEIEAFIRGSDGTEGLIGELIRLGSGRDYAGKLEMMKRAQEMRKLDDLEVTEDMIRKPNADGGIMRLGLKEGSGMSRRTFLKFLAGAASIPIVGKIFKPLKIGKTVTKVPIIKTDNVPGKPEWFDQLVNKVILEGDEVTKRFATKDREIVHIKVLDKGTGGKEFPPGTPGSDDISIMVTQDLDAGAVRVEYRNPENMYGDPVQLRYKKPNPDEGDPRPSAEFDTAESIPVARADGPDDYSIDIDEGGGQSIKDLTSDVSKLKEYATGQKPTLKEFVQSKKRKDKARAISQGEGEAESDFIINRQGEEIVEYPEPDFDDVFASGGIARMLGE